MAKEILDFQNALLTRRIVARTISSMEHATPEARKEYLHEHPGADPKNHSVKKETESGKGKEKDEGKFDSKAVEKFIKSTHGVANAARKSIEGARRFKKTYDSGNAYKGDKDKAKANGAKIDEAAGDLDIHLSSAIQQAKWALAQTEGSNAPGIKKVREDVSKYIEHSEKTLDKAKESFKTKLEDLGNKHLVDSKLGHMESVADATSTLAGVLSTFKSMT